MKKGTKGQRHRGTKQKREEFATKENGKKGYWIPDQVRNDKEKKAGMTAGRFLNCLRVEWVVEWEEETPGETGG